MFRKPFKIDHISITKSGVSHIILCDLFEDGDDKLAFLYYKDMIDDLNTLRERDQLKSGTYILTLSKETDADPENQVLLKSYIMEVRYD